MLCHQFGHLSTVTASRIIREAFPYSQSGRASTSDHSTIILGVTLVAQPHLYLEQLCREIEAIKAENVQLRATIDQIRSDVTVLKITGLSH